MRLSNYVANTFAGVAANFRKLDGRFVDNGRDFRDLIVGEAKLPAQTVLHALGHHSRRVLGKQKVVANGHGDEDAGRAAGHEDQQEPGNQFPLQGAVHCATSSWIAESAMVNSLPDASIASVFRLNSS